MDDMSRLDCACPRRLRSAAALGLIAALAVGCTTADADTTGAVCGQLAGAYFGESGIPRECRDRLRGRTIIDTIMTRLLLRAP